MKILILSDSHSAYLDLDFAQYDCVIHCGDYGKNYELLERINAYYVKGNCDFYGDLENYCYKLGKKMLIVHGHMFNVKLSYDRLVYKALEANVDFCFFGHTHYACIFKEDNTYFINPGAYEDGYYAILEDMQISFYLGDKIVKQEQIKW